MSKSAVPHWPPGSDRLLVQTRRRLRELGLRARKGLAQHYLVDEEARRLIIASAELDPTDIVIEVGPGLGVLTGELVAGAGLVIGVELDAKLAAMLKDKFAAAPNFVIINEDILKVDPAALIEDFKDRLPPSAGGRLDYKVVANLPYYITSPVLRHFLEARIKPRLMVLTVQKEVAEAIAAAPGRMSILSVSVQFYGRPRVIGYIPAASFFPAPEVDSAVLRVDVYPQPALPVPDIDGFFRVVRAGFAAARKQLANSLAQGLGLPKAEALGILERAGIDPGRRAETLSIEEWGRIWRELNQKAG